MKRFLFILLVSFTLMNTAQSQDVHPGDQLDALIGKNKNVGMVAAYSIDGETKWHQGAGKECADGEHKFNSETLTRIASICKSMTAVAIMQLVEKDLIDLDAPIGNYLPDLPEDKQKITARQLLSQTSGIAHYPNSKEVENTIHYNSLAQAMSVFIDRPLKAPPGTEYHYTTYGYVVLGRIIEEVASTSYSDYMQNNIFDIAEMKNTFVEDINGNYPNKSCLYTSKGKKTKKGEQNDLSNRTPGGGFISTAEDLLKFGNALIEEKLITQESLEAMFEIQPVSYAGNKYGLGWTLYGPPPHESVVIGHSGGQTGCSSQLFIVPQSKTVVVVLSNTSGRYDEIVNLASSILNYSELQE